MRAYTIGAAGMRRSETQRGALSMGQLARQWGLGVDRVRRLVETGLLPGSFKIPSAGKYGEAIRIRLSTVIQVEQEWVIPEHGQELMDKCPRPRQRGRLSSLTHFPELSHERGGVCREGDQR